MTRRKTTEQFVSESRAVHGEMYDYSKVVYIDCKTPVEIICPVHKSFFQMPKKHLKHICPKCALSENGRRRRGSAEDFVNKSKEIHGETYLYDKVNYTYSNEYVTIVCRTHGDFEQTPHNHLLGQGCPACFADSRRKSKDSFITDAKRVHGRLYDYSEVEYRNNHTKVRIACSQHGTFLQTPTNHLGGAGCPHCCENGYRVSKAGSLYVLKSDDIVKVGITNKSAKERANYISNRSGRKFEVFLELRFNDGRIPLNIETEVLKDMRLLYKNPEDNFNGYSECFKDADIDFVFLSICTKYKQYLDVESLKEIK